MWTGKCRYAVDIAEITAFASVASYGIVSQCVRR
jgi:hypothetical protein